MSAKPMNPHVKRLNRISAFLMIVMLACQFLPYWQFGEGEAVSLHGYVWFPTDHAQLAAELNPLVPKYPSNQAAMACIPVLLLCVFGAFFCLTKAEKQRTGVWPLLAGAAGLVLYLTSPVMRAGFLCWAHIALLALIFVAGLGTLLLKLPENE